MNETNLSILLFQRSGQKDEKCVKIFSITIKTHTEHLFTGK